MSDPTWIKAASEFGADAIANGRKFPIPTKADRDDIAAYHPAGEWVKMPKEDRDAAWDAFMAGAADERKIRL